MIVKLGSLISEYSVRNKADEDIPVYSVTNEQGFCTGYFSKEVASQDRTTYKIVPRGCFAYNPSRINVGSVDVQECEDRVIVSPLYVVFSVDEKLNRRYLLHYLKSDITLTYIKAYASGSVRDNLKFSILKDFPINLPSAEEQGQIVATLDGIEHLIALRKEEIASLDELVKSRFIELFGDLASPDCKWETKKLVETCVAADDIKCGPFGTQLSKDEYVDSGVAVWEIPQINSLFATLPTHYLTEEKAKELDAYSIKAGDIAMSRKGNVGKCAVFPISFASGIIHSDVLRIRVDGSQVLPLFMMHQLHYSGSVQHQIELVSAGAIMAGINVTKLKQISVHIPPMRLQQQFVAFVEQTDKSKLAVQNALEELEILKKSLMKQYFG